MARQSFLLMIRYVLMQVACVFFMLTLSSFAEDPWQTQAENALSAGNSQEAIAICRSEAEQGHTQAMEVLAKLLLSLPGDSSKSEALSWIEKSATQGSVRALEWLGEIYLLGAFDIPQNLEKARDYLNQAIERPDAIEAYYWLGKIAAEGIGQPPSPEEAVDLLRKAEQAGSSQAMTTLARLYMTDKQIPADYEEAYRLALNARPSGDPEAEYLLGVLTERFYPKPLDPKASYLHFQTAAQAGHIEALTRMGFITLERDKADSLKAHNYFLRAAQGGNIEAILQVSQFYRNRDNLHFDPIASETWLRRALPSKHPQVLNDYGMHFFKGLGLETSSTEALKYFHEAAQNGFPPAMLNAATLLGETEPVKALEYLREASSLRYSPAFSLLAEKLESQPTSLHEAAYWYQRATIQDPQYMEKATAIKQRLSPEQLKKLNELIAKTPS